MARRVLSGLSILAKAARQDTFRLFSSTPVIAVFRDSAQGGSRRPVETRSVDPISPRAGPSRDQRGGRIGETSNEAGRTRISSTGNGPQRRQKTPFGLRSSRQEAPVTMFETKAEQTSASPSSERELRAPASPTHTPDERVPSPPRQASSRSTRPVKGRNSVAPPMSGSAVPPGADQASSSEGAADTRPWRPTKKLTYQAMAGLRALHINDPVTFDRNALSERFGISYEAVNRILRSKYQDKKGGETGKKLQGTKWALDANSSRTSPVPAVKRAFAGRR